MTEERNQYDIYDKYRIPPQGCGTAIAGGLAMLILIGMAIYYLFI